MEDGGANDDEVGPVEPPPPDADGGPKGAAAEAAAEAEEAVGGGGDGGDGGGAIVEAAPTTSAGDGGGDTTTIAVVAEGTAEGEEGGDGAGPGTRAVVEARPPTPEPEIKWDAQSRQLDPDTGKPLPEPVISDFRGGQPDVDLAKQIMNSLLSCWDTDEAKERLKPILDQIDPKWHQGQAAKHLMLYYIPAATDIAEKVLAEYGYRYNAKSEGRTFERILKQIQEVAKVDEILMFQLFILKQKFLPIEHRPEKEPPKPGTAHGRHKPGTAKGGRSRPGSRHKDHHSEEAEGETAKMEKKDDRSNDPIYQAMMKRGSVRSEKKQKPATSKGGSKPGTPEEGHVAVGTPKGSKPGTPAEKEKNTKGSASTPAADKPQGSGDTQESDPVESKGVSDEGEGVDEEGEEEEEEDNDDEEDEEDNGDDEDGNEESGGEDGGEAAGAAGGNTEEGGGGDDDQGGQDVPEQAAGAPAEEEQEEEGGG